MALASYFELIVVQQNLFLRSSIGPPDKQAPLQHHPSLIFIFAGGFSLLRTRHKSRLKTHPCQHKKRQRMGFPSHVPTGKCQKNGGVQRLSHVIGRCSPRTSIISSIPWFPGNNAYRCGNQDKLNRPHFDVVCHDKLHLIDSTRWYGSRWLKISLSVQGLFLHASRHSSPRQWSKCKLGNSQVLQRGAIERLRPGVSTAGFLEAGQRRRQAFG